MSVRLLVNENFPAPSIKRLRAAGLDVASIGETSPGIDDEQVLRQSVDEQRWLVTFDRDYGELLFARGLAAPPAVILLRVPSYRPEEPAEWLMQLARDADARQNLFTVFDGKSIRSRPLLQVRRGST
jgi:predicted nuclease of predicted toxin-antitoxin system